LAPLSIQRRLIAFAAVIIGLPLLTVVLTAVRRSVSLDNALLAYLLFAVVVSAVGGVWPAIFGTAGAFLVLDYYFAPPIHTFTMTFSRDVVSLVAFIIISGVVSVFADVSARRRADARRTRREAQGLARMAASMLTDDQPLPRIMNDLVNTFNLAGVSLLTPTAAGWHTEAAAGAAPPTAPVDGDGNVTVVLNPGAHLVVRGPALTSEDEAVLRSFGSQLAVALETQRLQRETQAATALAKTNQLRSGLLNAVSHDLRTPLATIKAAVTSLLSPDVHIAEQDEQVLLQSIDSQTDRLNSMVADLLDMSRIRAGALVVQSRAVAPEEVLTELLEEFEASITRVSVEVRTERLIDADPALLQRVLVNIVGNAMRYSPAGKTVTIVIDAGDTTANIRVIDHGPGISNDQREEVLRPFQRSDDVPAGHGVGLGLAISNGFVEAMHGSLAIESTEGGGATVVVGLPLAEE
jgi:two-component system sensor histidine kinase KdpD